MAFVALASLAFLLLCGQPAVAANPFFHFDPASCKHDTGHMYVALGRAVVIVPTPKQADTFVEPLPSDGPHLKAHDPTEPVGCFGNPLQSSSFDLLWSANLMGNAPGDVRLGVPSLLELIGSRPLSGDRRHFDGLGLFHLKIANELCRMATVHEDLPNGLIACRIKPTNPPNAPQVDWAASYVAKRGAYSTPYGSPFVVNCDSDLSQWGPNGGCEVGYEYDLDFGVVYKFEPITTSHPIPISRIIAFDKYLRAMIASAIVKNYPWPK